MRLAKASVALVLSACTAVAGSQSAFAAQGQPFLTGTADSIYLAPDGAGTFWTGQTAEANGDIARIDISWRGTVISPSEPQNPRDPDDPGYDFSGIDLGVRNAAAAGLTPMITVQVAPSWAEGENAPPNDLLHPAGTWKPNPQKLGAFAEALGRRYSGNFQDLPRVTYFEAWNEPSLSLFLNPQFDGKERVAPEHYRKMLNAFYKGVNEGNKGAKVIAGSTGPFGSDDADGFRIRPLDFMRELLCVKGHKNFERGCSNDAKFDVYSHHPINLNGDPRRSAIDFDDISAAADMDRIVDVLRAAERFGTTTPGRHPVWATEIWWETEPPDPRDGFSLTDQANWYQEAMYLLDKNGVSAMVLLQLVDSPFTPAPRGERNGFQSGIFFVDGTPKPSLTAFSFPFVTERRSKSEILAWTIPPGTGKLVIQRRTGGKWKTVEQDQVRGGRPYQTTLRLQGSAKLRASLGDETSLTWTQKAGNGGGRSEGSGGAGRSAGSHPAALAPYVEAPR